MNKHAASPAASPETIVQGDGSAVRLGIDAQGIVRQIEGTAAPVHARGQIGTLGLVDLQVNGFAGVDFNDPRLTPEAFDRALAAMARTGVGTCLPTLISAAVERLEECFAALERARARSELATIMVPGYHLEGPFLSAIEGYRGCHPAEAMRPADPAMFDRLNQAAGSRIRLLTVAPEIPGALATIRHARKRGVAVALGHTAADRATVAAAAEAGASLSTHLGNATPKLLPRGENSVMAQLAEDRLHASFIADGIHVPPDTLRIYMRAKEPSRCVLVTDATAGAGAPEGDYTLGPVAIRRMADGSVRDGVSPGLAGSALTMDAAVRNTAAWMSLGLPQAVALARDHPLRILGMDAKPKIGAPVTVVRWQERPEGWTVVACQVGERTFHQVG